MVAKSAPLSISIILKPMLGVSVPSGRTHGHFEEPQPTDAVSDSQWSDLRNHQHVEVTQSFRHSPR
eukprot:3756801-Amphidinium_carterae.1